MGRTKYTKERVDDICKRLREKKGRVTAVSMAGIDYQTFINWMDSKPEFKKKVEQAEKDGNEYGREYAISCIFRNMQKNWTAAAWWIERNYPSEFASPRDRSIMERNLNDHSIGDRLREVVAALKKHYTVANEVSE